MDAYKPMVSLFAKADADSGLQCPAIQFQSTPLHHSTPTLLHPHGAGAAAAGGTNSLVLISTGLRAKPALDKMLINMKMYLQILPRFVKCVNEEIVSLFCLAFEVLKNFRDLMALQRSPEGFIH